MKKKGTRLGRVSSHVPATIRNAEKAFSQHSKLDFAFLFSRNGVKKLEMPGVGL